MTDGHGSSPLGGAGWRGLIGEVIMTAEIINLRRVRRARARAEKEQLAEANRRKHGRTRAERTSDEDDRARSDRRLDGLVLDCSRKGASDDGSPDGTT